MLGYRAIERRVDLRVTLIDLRLLQIGLILVDGRLVEVAGRAPWSKLAWVEICRENERLLTIELICEFSNCALAPSERRLRLIHLQLVGFRLDDEELRALLDRRAVLVIDFLKEALHPGDKI